MKYHYYPGCSLEGSAKEYDAATRALMSAMAVELVEIPDWTCCGASAAESVGKIISLALPARNLALSQTMEKNTDILVPCSACYLNLKKTEIILRQDKSFMKKVNEILAEDQLEMTGGGHTRHLLDILSRDLGETAFGRKIQRPLEEMTIAPYYGCQCLRPYAVFDDPESPVSMEKLILSTGARIHPWDMGNRCCGASHMNTHMDTALRLVGKILKASRGADAIVTVCPMCQINLEGYQEKISEEMGEKFEIAILYLPQLLGLAIGIPEDQLGLHLNLSVSKAFRQKLNLEKTSGE